MKKMRLQIKHPRMVKMITNGFRKKSKPGMFHKIPKLMKGIKLKVNPDLEAGLSKNSSPIEFFNLFVTSELLDMILEQTQLYATYQSLNNSKDNRMDEITVEDIKKA